MHGLRRPPPGIGSAGSPGSRARDGIHRSSCGRPRPDVSRLHCTAGRRLSPRSGGRDRRFAATRIQLSSWRDAHPVRRRSCPRVRRNQSLPHHRRRGYALSRLVVRSRDRRARGADRRAPHHRFPHRRGERRGGAPDGVRRSRIGRRARLGPPGARPARVPGGVPHRAGERVQPDGGEPRGVRPRHGTRLALPVEAVATAEAAVRRHDIVVAASKSRSAEPVVRPDWLGRCRLLCAVGNTRPQFAEIDPRCCDAARLVVVDTAACDRRGRRADPGQGRRLPPGRQGDDARRRSRRIRRGSPPRG